MPRFTRVASYSTALLFTTAAIAGCSSGAKTPAGPATFHVPDGFVVQAASTTCLLHQTDAPTKEFMGGSSASLALQLPFMAYLTANGTKPFCDGKPATDIDKKWAELYVTLTGQADKVTGMTGGK